LTSWDRSQMRSARTGFESVLELFQALVRASRSSITRV
jgi:hypothetical protein